MVQQVLLCCRQPAWESGKPLHTGQVPGAGHLYDEHARRLCASGTAAFSRRSLAPRAEPAAAHSIDREPRQSSKHKRGRICIGQVQYLECDKQH